MPATILAALVVSAAYFGAAKLSLSFASADAGVGPIWPASGIALAAVLLGGRRLLPAVALAAFLASVTGSASLKVAAGVALASALEALVGAALMRRVGFRASLQRQRDVAALAVLAGVLSTALSATVGIGTFAAFAGLAAAKAPGAWLTWWLADMAGDLLIATAILALASTSLSRRALRSEASLLTPLVVLSGLIAWGTVLWLNARGHRALIADAQNDGLLRAQAFVGVATIGTLLLVASRSERTAAESALKRLTEREQTLTEAQRIARIGSFEWDVVSDQMVWSDELYRILGLDRAIDPASYRSWQRRIHEDDRKRVDASISRGRAEGTPYSFAHRIVRPDGQLRTIECHGRVKLDASGTPVRMVGTAQDVTRLTRQANHDPLTGLPNRTLLLDRLELALRRAQRSDRTLAVVFLDVDDFKLVNDTCGHEVGDRLLVALTLKLRAALRPGDTIARLGGDEFVVVCEELCDEEDAAHVAQRITDACSTSLVIGSEEHDISVSAGLVLVVDPQEVTASALLREADATMYRAKRGGKGRVEIFDEGTGARLIERFGLGVAAPSAETTPP